MDTPLKTLRLARGLTLQDVADAVGSDTGNISRIENGEQKSVELAPRLAKFFGEELTVVQVLYPEEYPLAPPKRSAKVRSVAP